ncbi:MAG: hypothetical protein CMM99_01585 [Rickettsiales bacterium]|nr:hypothetical protein [Rickettsiales bacterium]|tara:strand:+ start:712 stop:1449 length:738 start_codon:yes stop_codon:yes gene_type:complete
MKKIFAVIISYNNEKTIKKLYDSINKEFFYKIILIDDCSTDNTFSIAKTLGCECFQNEKNLGMGGNLKKSMQIAFEMGADYVLEVHGDNQYNPNEIIKAKDLIHKDYDLIIGSRFVNKNPFKKDGMPFLRYLANKIFSKITSFLLDINLSEFHTGFKLFSKNFHSKVPYELNSNSYLFSFQIILQAKLFNLKTDEVSISSVYNDEVTSCNYFEGFIYLLRNFEIIILFFLAKFKIFNHSIFHVKK